MRSSAPPTATAARVTLTVPALSSASAVWLTASGEGKAGAIARATADDAQLPASRVGGRQETVWWLDEAAAAGLDEPG